MLRKKLLTRLGLLLVGFVAGAVVSIMLLQDVLRDLDQMNAHAAILMDGVQELESEIAAIELSTDQGATAHAGRLSAVMDKLAGEPVMSAGGAGAESFQRLAALVPQVTGESASPSEKGAAPAVAHAGASARIEAMELGRIARRFVGEEQTHLSRRLRGLVIGLTIAALVMVNITAMVLLGTANMILRPVRELVECSRDLAREQFDRRVQIDQQDEFAELAHAYNHLASELECNEQRKVQAMRHLAVTLNHELLNVISSIDMQLRLVDLRSGDQQLSGRLREIHQSLARIADTISSLRNVRRIVLTDYLPGQKMLDLGKSVAADEASPEPAPSSAAGVNRA